MPPYPGFGGGSYQSRSLTADCERCLNLYPEAVESKHGANVVQDFLLYGTPGKYLAGTIASAPGAALVPADTFGFPDGSTPIWYAVVGTMAYAIAFQFGGSPVTPSIVPIFIGQVDSKAYGSVAPGLFPAQIIVLGDQWIFVLANGKAWVIANGTPIAASILAVKAPISFSVLNSGGLAYAPGDTGQVTGPSGAVLANYIVRTVAGTAAITNSALFNGGTGYAVGDTGTISTGGANAAYVVDSVDGSGTIITYHLTAPGSGYAEGTGIATATGGGQPGAGTGFTVVILGIGGAVLTYTLLDGGQGYAIASGVATVTAGAQPGYGTGFTIDITSTSGGKGYAVGDTGAINGPRRAQAFYVVGSVDGNGSILTYSIGPNPTAGYGAGAGYGVGATIGTTQGGTQPFPVGSAGGDGFYVDITAIGAVAWATARQTIAGFLPDDYFVEFATYMDGYAICSLAPNSGGIARRSFYVSGVGDPTTWDALEFGVKESNPDPLIACFAAQGTLLLLGTQTIEIWYDSGNVNFQFQRISGGVVEGGCANGATIQKMDGTIVWMGQDARGVGVVWELQGLIPTRISTHAIEARWRNFDLGLAIGQVYQEAGHYFYELHFPDANQTWVYDSTTHMWHERASFDGTNYNADFGRFLAYNSGASPGHAALDYRNGNVYMCDIGYWDEAGTPILRERVLPPLVDNFDWAFYNHARLLAQQGNPAASDAYLDSVPGGVAATETPSYTMELSPDGGQTYQTAKTGTGSASNTGALVEWWRLGRFRQFAIRLRSTSRVNQAWVNFFIETEKGRGY